MYPVRCPARPAGLYAQNVLNVIMLMTRDGRFAPDFDDEITSAMCVTHAGNVLRDGG
jgi:NAD(P) transhydrogenase subunit alpha